ncbi:MAG: hypothetical protein DRQ65_05030 [Gammaproteobacteria bacterium]|nr:MAG: hypothetical protein DRQ65_05030 [Gammaproteobacteria bacterium]RLA55616.1 MAG: hypothetical protein DRQ98_04575 [Gammaproteobacteria bacterium]HDY82183.1 hypothetical protein [Halieaceae bacterium]
MNIIKPVTALSLLCFTGVFIWAGFTDPGLVSFVGSLGQPWPTVVLLDFVFGCLLFSWMIYFVEGSAKSAIPWAVALFVVGNIVSAIYILVRFDKIQQRIGSGNA